MRLAFFVSCILFFLCIPHSALAQENVLLDIPTPTVVSPTPMPAEYQLPYPGILPDNPFYVLKTARDRFVGMLISNPVRKAEFNILQADKRLNAAVMLFDQKGSDKQRLAESTIAKGENYFEDALVRVQEAKKQSMDTTDVRRKLLRSATKHQQVVAQLIKKAEPGVAKDLQVTQGRIDRFLQQAQALAAQK